MRTSLVHCFSKNC